MISLHPSLDQVFRVEKALPTFGARVGDEIVIRPSDATFPFVLRRSFPAEMIGSIPDNSVLCLGASNAEIPHCERSLELTFAVKRAIPHLGAHNGDELAVRPTDKMMPFVLRRSFPLELAAALPEEALSLRGAAEISDGLASKRRRGSAPARALSLVRRVG